MNTKRTSPSIRFWKKVEKTEACWNWTASLLAGGYGRFGMSDRKTVLAHRYSYELLVGHIAAGMTIDHLCKNRKCVNPDHMEVVTRGENSLRGESDAARNSRKLSCKRGHPFTSSNTSVKFSRIKNRHYRVCKKCHADYERARRANAAF